MTEEWRAVPGFAGYEVSDLGRVRSWHGPRAIGGGSTTRAEPLMMKPATHRNGRKHVMLARGGRRITGLIHRLVLEAFVGPCPEGMECCHGNGVPADNRLENLRWDTKAANEADKRRHGTISRRSGPRKLTLEQVAEVRTSNEPARAAAKRLKVTVSTIFMIRRGERWSEATMAQLVGAQNGARSPNRSAK